MQALRKGGRVMKETVATAATLKCIERLQRLRPPCRLHLQLSLYRVGAAEVKAAQQQQQLSSQVLTHCKVLASPFMTGSGYTLPQAHCCVSGNACHVSSNSLRDPQQAMQR